MRVLIVSGFFYPTNTPRAFRTAELVKEFVRQGHSVTLYSPKQNFDYSYLYSKYPFNHIQYEEATDKLSCHHNWFVRVLGRVLVYEMAYPHIKLLNILPKYLKKERRDYDLMITIAVPHQIHWTLGSMYRQGERFAKIWVADCGDPFMLAQSVNRKKPFYFKWMEKRWCSLCDYISVPTDTSYMGYYPEYHSKIKVIPQGFNFKETDIPTYASNDVPTFVFAGGFIKGKRDPRKLMNFLSNVDRPFRFIVYGANAHQFLDRYKNRLGERLEVREPIARDALIPKLAEADFLINIGNGTKVQTPSKLIDYTLAGRPILTIETDDVKEDILMEFLDGRYDNRDKPIDISCYDIHNIVQHFISLCR